MIQVECPSCHHKMEMAEPEELEDEVHCPVCEAAFVPVAIQGSKDENDVEDLIETDLTLDIDLASDESAGRRVAS